jgi:hypothetical protein
MSKPDGRYQVRKSDAFIWLEDTHTNNRFHYNKYTPSWGVFLTEQRNKLNTDYLLTAMGV